MTRERYGKGGRGRCAVRGAMEVGGGMGQCRCRARRLTKDNAHFCGFGRKVTAAGGKKPAEVTRRVHSSKTGLDSFPGGQRAHFAPHFFLGGASAQAGPRPPLLTFAAPLVAASGRASQGARQKEGKMCDNKRERGCVGTVARAGTPGGAECTSSHLQTQGNNPAHATYHSPSPFPVRFRPATYSALEPWRSPGSSD